MNSYIELTKPRITWLILMSTGIGYFFGWDGQWNNLSLLLHTIIGTGLIASGTAALNQWYESEADAKMKRTNQRPIPSGRVTSRNALYFGTAIAILGFAELVVGANLLTGMLGLFTLGSYLFLYTPLKQTSWLSTTVGAVPGAMPPMIGFAAARGGLTAEAWVLFAILFLWQFPHFYAIAWMYRDDYKSAGIQMLPVVEPDGNSTSRHMLVFALFLVPVSLLPVYYAMAGKIYFAGALLLGMTFVYACWQVFNDRSLLKARGVLKASVIYLPLLYCLMVLDRTGF